MHTFKVETREPEFPGRQISADVVRDDGKVIRSGLWPDYAEVECKLLNEMVATGMSAEAYHKERAKRLRTVRQHTR
jgi:hypothetical protein